MKWFDKADAVLLAKIVLVGMVSSLMMVSCAAVAGASVHVFRVAAGG